MDNISINKANYLYWMGRYAERAYTSIVYFKNFYDEMVDKNPQAYLEFCRRLGINNYYENKTDFIRNFIYNDTSDISIIYYLNRTYDNGIMLRDIITSKTLSYIQLACNVLKKCNNNEEYIVVNLQQVTDYLIAFWGAVDDYVLENDARDFIKSGKYIERIELYNRFEENKNMKKAAMERLLRYAVNLKVNENTSYKIDITDITDNSNYNFIKNYIGGLSEWGSEQ